jgi:hypothetical protein
MDGTAYLARTVGYARKMLMTLTTESIGRLVMIVQTLPDAL